MRNQMNLPEYTPTARCYNLVAGITAVISIIGGVYLITKTTNDLLSKISNRKQKQHNEKELFCNVCCAEIDVDDDKTCVKCYVCKKYICRNTDCFDWLSKIAKWECKQCQSSKESLAQTTSWVADQITFNQETLKCPTRARSEIYIPINEYNDNFMHFESVSQVGGNNFTITAEQKCKIREFVEEIVAKLLGGNLDKVAVNQLSKSENYLPDPNSNSIHNATSQDAVPVKTNGYDFSELSETRLRQMIQKIVAETMSLPPLVNGNAVSEIALNTPSRRRGDIRSKPNNGYHQRHRTEHYFEPTIYQDLLATAVLNKIVANQLDNQGIPHRDTGDDDACDGDINFNNRFTMSDQNCNIPKSSTSSGSSIEPQSDCSYTEMEHVLNNNDDKSFELLRNSDRDSVMSDYLANHMVPLPDLNAMATQSDEDDYISVTSSAIGDGTWEKNWLFKKKRCTLSSSVAANSVGMLVPDPKEDVRAQIGDKTADEVSDLSEFGSDSDNSLTSLSSQLEPINDRLVNKHLIGGQNSKIILDEIIERSSMTSNTLPNDGPDPVYTDAFNEDLINVTTKTEAFNDNVTQQQSSIGGEKFENSAGVLSSFALENLNSNSLAGSIAEREYKKWYNAVEMPNNPYAPEALKRRISSGSQERFIALSNISPTKDLNAVDLLNEPKLDSNENALLESDIKRYSRDYYINSSLMGSQISSSARNVSEPVTKDNREPTMRAPSNEEIESDIDLYKAMPAQIVETDPSIETPTLMETNSTGDDSDTLKVSDSQKSIGAQAIINDTAKAQSESQKGPKVDGKQNTSSPTLSRSEGIGNVIGPIRGSTPVAFKFLQPKRRLLEPNQVLTVDEEDVQAPSIPSEKPVIEEEVVKALPSVKALAKAFLMTTNTSQPEHRWLSKARTLSHGGRNKATTTSLKTSLDQHMQPDRLNPDDDMTITSDLSSLETDCSFVSTDIAAEADLTHQTVTTVTSNASPVTVRQGVLKNNIAFFENLKNK